MVDIPYHTHTFDIPTASEGEIRAGLEAGKAITPDRLFPVLADKADKATTLAGYGITDAATKEQGLKADTAVQPAQVSAVGFSGRYADLLNKPNLGDASTMNVGTSAGTIAAGDDARIVGAVQKATTVTAGAGLAGGGTLAANIAVALSSTSLASLALADSAVQPARKLIAGSGLAGGGDFSADRTVALNAASIASLAKADTAVQPARKLSVGAGLSGGGDFTTDRTVALNAASIASLAKADSAVQPSELGALARKDKIATSDIAATGSTSGGALLTQAGVWVDPSGGGDMYRLTYDPKNKLSDAFDMSNMDEAENAKIMTADERTKLAGIAAGATANTGTVTSVGVAVPAGLSATGAITTTGTITISYASGYQGYTTTEANKLAGIAAGADKTPVLATVATSGSYNDLGDKPAIPAAQVQIDWNATSGIASIKDKPASFPPSAHPHTAAQVGLGNVDNTSDASKPVSTAQQAALNTKASYNWIINGDFTINQRGGVKKPANGVYGFDRWKGHANGIEQIIEALPAGEYTLTWSGGGNGTFGGQTKASPIKAIVAGGNTSVVVPEVATKVSLVSGDATTKAPWNSVERLIQQELDLCLRYFERISFAGNSDNLTASCGEKRSLLAEIPLLVKKRAIPTITSNILTSNYSNTANGAQANNWMTGCSGISYATTPAGINVVEFPRPSRERIRLKVLANQPFHIEPNGFSIGSGLYIDADSEI